MTAKITKGKAIPVSFVCLVENEKSFSEALIKLKGGVKVTWFDIE